MKRFLYLFTLIICLSCTKEKLVTPPDPEPKDTPQTTLMYLTGTELSYFFTKNIAAARQGVKEGALGDGRFLIFRHTNPMAGVLMELSLENGVYKETQLKVYDQNNGGNIKSLSKEGFTRVFNDVVDIAPADSYNLIISGHGTGWVPKTNQSPTWQSLVEGDSANDSYFDMWKQDYTNLSSVTRYLGSPTDGLFDITELHETLSAAETHFGFIIFDMCFMSSVEVLYELRNLSDYIVASPCEIMGAGFPYDTTLKHLFADNGYGFDLQGACQSYYDYYSTNSYPSGCIAMTVCAQLESLASCVKEINSLYDNSKIDIEALQPYERLANPLFLDLEDYINSKCEDKDLLAKFTAKMEQTFPTECRLHTPKFFANIGVYDPSSDYYTPIGDTYSGVSTSAPSSQFRTAYEQTSWFEATH